jgi:hypothetical protein
MGVPSHTGAHRHLGLIAEAVLAERAAIREAVAAAMAAPGTDPESAEVTRIIERLQAGESPVAIARPTGAIAGPDPGPLPLPGAGEDGGAASGEPRDGTT